MLTASLLTFGLSAGLATLRQAIKGSANLEEGLRQALIAGGTLWLVWTLGLARDLAIDVLGLHESLREKTCQALKSPNVIYTTLIVV
jgi:hypothetical protein